MILNPNGPQQQPQADELEIPPTGPLRPTADPDGIGGEEPTKEPADAEPEPPKRIVSFFPPAAQETRLPIPSAEDQARRSEQIAELFPLDRARTYADKTSLAQSLLKTARDSESQPAALYVLLQKAQDVAADAGNVALAFDAIDQLDAKFQVDGLELRYECAAQASQATAPPAVRSASVESGIDLVEQLLAADRFQQAARLISNLQALARKIRTGRALRSWAN